MLVRILQTQDLFGTKARTKQRHQNKSVSKFDALSGNKNHMGPRLGPGTI